MSTLNRYSLDTSGINAAVFVSPAVEYSTDNNLSEFIANAVEGEIAVILKDNSVKSNALSSGDEFKIVQKRDGLLHQTPLIAFDDIIRKARTDYSAPAKQITSVGYNKTADAGSLGIDLSTPGVQELVISVRVTTPGNQPFPVEEGRAISESVSDEQYAILRKLVDDLNNTFDYEQNQDESVIVASIQSDGTVSAIGTTTLAISNGSTTATYSAAHSLNAGDYVSIDRRVFKVDSVTSTTVIELDAPYTGASVTTMATGTADGEHGSIAYTDGTTELGVILEGVDTDTHFAVSAQDELDGATITEEQDWNLGSGDGDSVVRLEKEGRVFGGNGAVENAAFKEDFGVPSSFASLTETYDLFIIEAAPSIFRSAARPVTETKLEQNIIIAAPATGNTPTNELDTVLGL